MRWCIKKKVTVEDLSRVLRRFFGRVSTLGLATVDNEGAAHAVNVNFVADDELRLYFISDKDSAHSRHIAERSEVAGSVYSPFRVPSRIKGVQFRGRCVAMSEEDFGVVWPGYCRRFPYAVLFEDMARGQVFHRIDMEWVRWIDNSAGFGFKVETDWPLSLP